MSRFRTIGEAARAQGPQKVARGANGRRLCRWCGKEVPRGRQTFCSGQAARFRRGAVAVPGTGCVHEFLLRSRPEYARRHVLVRDHGVCRLCGLDCLELQKVASRLRGGDLGVRRELLEDHGFRLADMARMSLWEADHIQPVCEGGGECGLENLRTLCLPCHRRVTAELRSRLQEGRRRAPTAPTNDPPARKPAVLSVSVPPVPWGRFP